MTFPLIVASLLALAAPDAAPVAPAGPWPQWLGPNRDGKSAETGLRKGFPGDGPKLLWQVTDPDVIGTGYGSPAVVGGKIYLIGGDSAKKDAGTFCVCLNEADGKPVWKMPLSTSQGDFLDQWGGGPRATPTVDGDRLFVLDPTGDLVALETATGKVVWSKNLVKDFGGVIPKWGYSESVLVDGDKVVCTPCSKGGMVALSKATGEVVWKCDGLTDKPGYSSIVVTTVGGVRQYVQQTEEHAVGVDAENGKLLWSVGEIKRKVAVIPTPVVMPGGQEVFFTAGYGAGGELVRIADDGKSAKVVNTTKVMENHHGGVIEYQGKIFGHSNSKNWVCYDPKEPDDAVWSTTKLDKGSITYADGQFYCYGEGKGTLVTIKATDKGWEETGRFTIPETSKLRPKMGRVWAHPVVADGKLFLRDYELLFVYDISGPKKGK
jgi:outer membrane protein assembly factor BamB